jgi:GNAT superfamily N-acetyltransferase
MQIVRPAEDDDAGAIMELARQYGLTGPDSVQNARYRTLLSTHGRLLVAESGGEVVGFGGMIDLSAAAMVTDLFVAEDRHGHGVGRALLDGLLHDRPQRMTCSSAHPAAQRLYATFGMRPRWRLRYLRLDSPGAFDVVDVLGSEVRAAVADATDSGTRSGSGSGSGTDRPELDLLADDLRWVVLQRRGETVGHALFAPPAAVAAGWQLLRLRTSLPHDVAVRAALTIVPADESVECCVPEWSSAASLLASLGAIDVDADTFMSNLPPTADGIDRELAVINPGVA